jgi:Uma2 family endonuclease
MPELPETAWFGLAPDWICEVLSPGSVRKDRTLKMHKYARYEVQWLWIIDPIERYLEAYELRGGAWSLIATRVDDEPVRIKPFDATEFNLDALWA